MELNDFRFLIENDMLYPGTLTTVDASNKTSYVMNDKKENVVIYRDMSSETMSKKPSRQTQIMLLRVPFDQNEDITEVFEYSSGKYYKHNVLFSYTELQEQHNIRYTKIVTETKSENGTSVFNYISARNTVGVQGSKIFSETMSGRIPVHIDFEDEQKENPDECDAFISSDTEQITVRVIAKFRLKYVEYTKLYIYRVNLDSPWTGTIKCAVDEEGVNTSFIVENLLNSQCTQD